MRAHIHTQTHASLPSIVCSLSCDFQVVSFHPWNTFRSCGISFDLIFCFCVLSFAKNIAIARFCNQFCNDTCAWRHIIRLASRMGIFRCDIDSDRSRGWRIDVDWAKGFVAASNDPNGIWIQIPLWPVRLSPSHPADHRCNAQFRCKHSNTSHHCQTHTRAQRPQYF